MTKDDIIGRLSESEDASGGIACPVCQGPTGVVYTTHPIGHTTRRRMCGRCELLVTTSERIVGGYTREDLERARVKYQKWLERHGRIVSIAPSQRSLFEIE